MRRPGLRVGRCRDGGAVLARKVPGIIRGTLGFQSAVGVVPIVRGRGLCARAACTAACCEVCWIA